MSWRSQEQQHGLDAKKSEQKHAETNSAGAEMRERLKHTQASGFKVKVGRKK